MTKYYHDIITTLPYFERFKASEFNRVSRLKKYRKSLRERLADCYKPQRVADDSLRYTCFYCGAPAVDLDHVPPLSAFEMMVDQGIKRSEIDYSLRGYISRRLKEQELAMKRIMWGFDSADHAEINLDVSLPSQFDKFRDKDL